MKLTSTNARHHVAPNHKDHWLTRKAKPNHSHNEVSRLVQVEAVHSLRSSFPDCTEYLQRSPSDLCRLIRPHRSRMSATMGPSETKRVVCVTGASGFLASWLVKCLLADGYHVRGAVRDPENHEKAAHLWALPGAKERLELVKGDLLTEGSYDAAVSGCEGVFHTAMPLVFVKADPKAEMLDPAMLGTLNVLRSCVKASVKRVVLTSSSAAVRFRDDLERPGAKTHLDESSWSTIPFCTKYQLWYPLAKVLSEQEAWKFAFLHSLDLVVVAPSFVIGPCLPRQLSKTANDVLDLLNGGSDFGMLGRMGYVHVDDVARAHMLVYETPSAQGRYICSAHEITPQDLVDYLAGRYPDLPISTTLNGVPPMPYYTLNTAKLRQLGLKFQPLDAMFDDCIAFLEERGLLRRTTTKSVSFPAANGLPPKVGMLHNNVELAVSH